MDSRTLPLSGFCRISNKLDEISLAIDALNLWIDRAASENNLNTELLHKEKELLKTKRN